MKNEEKKRNTVLSRLFDSNFQKRKHTLIKQFATLFATLCADSPLYSPIRHSDYGRSTMMVSK